MLEAEILLVDDNDIDVMAFRRGMKKNGIENRLVIAGDGVEALAILRGTHDEKSISKPYIVFLDLNMPVMNGIEFLDELRRDPDLNRQVVFVLTTSDHQSDLFAAYRQQVAGYILKRDVADACAQLHEILDSFGREISPS